MKTIFTWIDQNFTAKSYAARILVYIKEHYNIHVKVLTAAGIDPDSEEYFTVKIKSLMFDRQINSHSTTMERFNRTANNQHLFFEQMLNSMKADNYERATELLNTALTEYAKVRDREVTAFQLIAK